LAILSVIGDIPYEKPLKLAVYSSGDYEFLFTIIPAEKLPPEEVAYHVIEHVADEPEGAFLNWEPMDHQRYQH